MKEEEERGLGEQRREAGRRRKMEKKRDNLGQLPKDSKQLRTTAFWVTGTESSSTQANPN